MSRLVLRDYEEYLCRLVSLDYPERDSKMNNVWQKSISKTKNLFLNSFHIPGSCLPQGKVKPSDATAMAMAPTDDGCAFYIEEAFIVHMHGIHYRQSTGSIEDPVPNELHKLQNVD